MPKAPGRSQDAAGARKPSLGDPWPRKNSAETGSTTPEVFSEPNWTKFDQNLQNPDYLRVPKAPGRSQGAPGARKPSPSDPWSRKNSTETGSTTLEVFSEPNWTKFDKICRIRTI